MPRARWPAYEGPQGLRPLLLQQFSDIGVVGSEPFCGLSVITDHDVKCMLDVRQNGVGAWCAQLLCFISEQQLHIL